MNYRQFFLIILFLLLASASYSELYKWTDANGQTHYGDKPPNNTAIPEPTLNKENTADIRDIRNNSQITYQALSDTYVLRIRALFEQSRFQKITDLLERLQSQTESDIFKEQALFQAFTAFDLNDIAHEPTFNRWILNHPNSAEAYLARARFYYSLGWASRGGKFIHKTSDAQLEKMQSYFDKSLLDTHKATQLDNKSLIPYTLRIGIAKARGDSTAAKMALNKALSISPASFYARTYYLDTLEPRWGGSYSEMDRFVITAQEQVAKNPKLKLLLGFSTADAAFSQYRLDNHEAANKLYKKALSFGESHDIYYLLGKNLYFQKNYTQAIIEFSRAIELYNTSSDFYYWRSKSYLKLLEYQSAHKDIKSALLLNPSDEKVVKFHKAFTKKIKQLRDQDYETEKASRDLVTLDARLKKSPDNADLHYQKAMAQIKLKKYEFAYRHLQEAISLAPNEFEYYRVMDYVFLKQGNFQKILTLWGEYLAINPNDPRAYSERGGAYTHLKELDLAIQDYKKAAELGDKEAKSTYEDLLTIKESGVKEW